MKNDFHQNDFHQIIHPGHFQVSNEEKMSKDDQFLGKRKRKGCVNNAKHILINNQIIADDRLIEF